MSVQKSDRSATIRQSLSSPSSRGPEPNRAATWASKSAITPSTSRNRWGFMGAGSRRASDGEGVPLGQPLVPGLREGRDGAGLLQEDEGVELLGQRSLEIVARA